MKKNMSNRYAPQRWSLNKVVHKTEGLLKKIWSEKKGSKAWYMAQFKREVEQMKKHIIFLEQIMEFYEKSEEVNLKYEDKEKKGKK